MLLDYGRVELFVMSNVQEVLTRNAKIIIMIIILKMSFANAILFYLNAALRNAFTIIEPAKTVAGVENVCISSVHEVVIVLTSAQSHTIIIKKKKRKDLQSSHCITSKLHYPMHSMIPKVCLNVVRLRTG